MVNRKRGLSAAADPRSSLRGVPPGAGQPQAVLFIETRYITLCIGIWSSSIVVIAWRKKTHRCTVRCSSRNGVFGYSGATAQKFGRAVYIHAFSSRAAGPFVAVDCPALPSSGRR